MLSFINNQFTQSKNSNLFVIYIFLGLILHLVSSYFSIGFYSDDEHFQILEPVAYLLGLNEVIIDKVNPFFINSKNSIYIISIAKLIIKESRNNLTNFVSFIK